jgi:hypothetical protein
LSDGLNQDCTCENASACGSTVNNLCAEELLVYPGPRPLLTSYVYMIYIWDHDWTNKKPDSFGYFGRVKCIGYHLIMNIPLVSTHNENFHFYRYMVWEADLCGIENITQTIRSSEGPHYDMNCWKNSKTFNNRSYQVSSLCRTRCISKYRMRDGVFDCDSLEEAKTINNTCPQIQRHRLQCSSSELSCLLAGAVGDWLSLCSNGRDEFDEERDIALFENIVCKKRTDSGCIYLRKYIQTSSENNPNIMTVVDKSISIVHQDLTTIIPFRSYCNSFFDTNSAVDESAELCKQWTCLNDEYQCLSGQCISQEWLCDGQFTLFVRFIFCSCLLCR